MSYPKKVTIKEVGPRDGLQNEPVWIATEDKITWINQLSRTGLSYIEITSFVHPKWIPALRDAIDVAKGIDREKGVTYAALVPNQRGLENALEGGINEACVFMSASETHNRKNINKSTSESLHILKQVNNDAKKQTSQQEPTSRLFSAVRTKKMSPLNKSFAFQKLYLNLGFLNFRLEIRLERLIPPKWKLYLKLFWHDSRLIKLPCIFMIREEPLWPTWSQHSKWASRCSTARQAGLGDAHMRQVHQETPQLRISCTCLNRWISKQM